MTKQTNEQAFFFDKHRLVIQTATKAPKNGRFMRRKKTEENAEKVYPAMSFRPTEETRAKLRRVSDETGISISKLINRCLDVGLPIILNRSADASREIADEMRRGPTAELGPTRKN